ncbi:uncharacterized protein [Miscanthus floridulus]|uniref:uncharacterized protein n=1 Tax=Miscanthus floridulus TaxID=154761 RepID=UPI00345A2464
MHITPRDGSSNKKKDLPFKASQEKKGKGKIKEVIIESSSDYDSGDQKLVLMLGYLDHQFPYEKKDKYKKKNKDKKNDSSDDGDKEKKKYKTYKKDGKKKRFHKMKNGKAYIFDGWLTDIDFSSDLSSNGSDDEAAEKINHDKLVISYDLLYNDIHDTSNNVVKVDIATSCDDLIVESTEQGSCSKGKQVVVAKYYDDYVKMKNEKLKKDIEKLSINGTIIIEKQDDDYDMALEEDMLK